MRINIKFPREYILRKSVRILLPFVILTAITGILTAGYKALRIKKVIVISQSQEINGLSFLNGQNFLTVDSQNLTLKILGVNPYVKKLTVAKSFPNKLTLEIMPRIPLAVMSDSDNKEYYLDQEGLPADNKYLRSSTLPVIEGYKLPYRTNRPDWRVLKAVDLISLLTDENIYVERFFIDDINSSFILFLAEDEEVFLAQNFNPPEISASLQTIISRFRIEGKFISKIDFRFDKPLVILKNE